MTRAEPGGTLVQNSWRSSEHASARGTSKRMSLEAYSIIFTTRAAHAGDWISSLHATHSSHNCSAQRESAIVLHSTQLAYSGAQR